MTPSTRTPDLVVEDDADFRETLDFLLADEGYLVTLAASPDEALAAIEQQAFACILTDLFGQRAHTQSRLAAARSLLERAAPTPVVLVTAWPLSTAEVEAAGFSAYIENAFDLDTLLFCGAQAANVAFPPKSQPQVGTTERYFAALTAWDWDALVALCTDEVTYVLPGELPFSTTTTGKAAFGAYTGSIFQHFPDARFEDVRAYATAGGVAASYVGRRTAPDGRPIAQSGAVILRMQDAHISRIGVQCNEEQLRAIGVGTTRTPLAMTRQPVPSAATPTPAYAARLLHWVQLGTPIPTCARRHGA